MKINFNRFFTPYFRLKDSAFFKFVWTQIFARNLYIKLTFLGLIIILSAIWALWLKIVLGGYFIPTPPLLLSAATIPPQLKSYLLPLVITIFVFINSGILALTYKKYPKIIYLVLPITFYLEIIVLATGIYFLIKF